MTAEPAMQPGTRLEDGEGPAGSGSGVPADPRAGAIYDIGFRHHEGARLGRGYVWTSLFANSLRGAYGLGRSARAKILPFILVGFVVLPTVVIALIAALTGVEQLAVAPSSYLTGGAALLLTIFVGAQAPQLVSRDLRYRTIALYLSRPLSRFQYVSARLAALVAAVFLFTAVPVTVLFLGGLLAELPWREQAADWLRGLVMAALSALVYAFVAIAIAAWTPRRGLGVAAIVIALFLSQAAAGIVYAVLSETTGGDAAGYALLLSPGTLLTGLESRLSGVGILDGLRVGTGLGLALAGGLVLLLAACAGLLALRYRKVGIA